MRRVVDVIRLLGKRALLYLAVSALWACHSTRTAASRPSESTLELDAKEWERESSSASGTPRKTDTPALSAPSGALANSELEAYVDRWVGTPYRYAGNTQKGVDCSGFVCAVYREHYNDPFQGRRSEDLFAEVEPIALEDLEPGDVVFFKIRGTRIDHVGVYLGDGTFVHSSTQKGVIRSRLDEPYYQKRFFKGGRKR
ncbi:glycoside hydrolase [bacterium]|nr:glycoside hydrolase [bacterium]